MGSAHPSDPTLITQEILSVFNGIWLVMPWVVLWWGWTTLRRQALG